MDKIEELIIAHVRHPVDVLEAYKYLEHEDWLEYDKEELISFVSYFKLNNADFDMIVAIHRDDIFSMGQWRIIKKYIINRRKELRINSDPSNDIIQLWVTKHGGYFDGEDIVLPKNN